MRDQYKGFRDRCGRTVFQGANHNHLLAYRQDPFTFAGQKFIFWSFVELESDTLADTSDERIAHDQHLVDSLPRFSKLDRNITTDMFQESTDAADSEVDHKNANLLFNSWSSLQILRFFRCGFSKVVAGYWQFFAVENFDFVKVEKNNLQF